MESLIIIESPNKIKKIKHYSGIETLATVGHFKDLPKKEIGLDLEGGTYRPDFQVMEGKGPTLANIKTKAKGRKVYIASDPDREGYAIGYHLYQEIKANAGLVYRAEINEITEKGVKAALAAAVPFDSTNFRFYDAFLGRRCGDRLTGYVLSPQASNELGELYSCGPVQSPANRLIVERERAIRGFRPEPFWNVQIILEKEGAQFRATAKQKNLKTIQEAQAIAAQVQGLTAALVQNVTTDRKATNPNAPFDTSSLTQAANATLHFPAEKTMSLAQRLFEAGLITYIRTDSFRIADEIITEIRGMLQEEFGAEYVAKEPRQHKNKNSQAEAHEAIRPTHIHAPGAMESRVMAEDGLTRDHLALYDLIYNRTVAAQMAPAVYDLTKAVFLVGEGVFEASGKTSVFDGFLKLTAKIKDDDADEEKTPTLPHLRQHESVKKIGQEIKDGQTTPPARFSEGGLIKELEKRGIGRPSTFASIVSGLKIRKYAEIEKNKLVPTVRGEKLHDYLAANHAWIEDYKIRADLEVGLDQVEQGTMKWTEVVRSQHEKMHFAKPSGFTISASSETIGKCPLCGKPVAVRKGFYGCEGYNRETPDAGCRFSIPGKWAGGTVTKKAAGELLTAGKTSSALKFVSKAGKPFTAILALKDGKIEMVFPDKSALGASGSSGGSAAGDAAPVGKCPLCGKGIFENAKAFGCAGYKDGCRFSIWKSTLGAKITATLAKQLLREGQTAKPVKCVSMKTKNAYDAVLILEDGKVKPRFEN